MTCTRPIVAICVFGFWALTAQHASAAPQIQHFSRLPAGQVTLEQSARDVPVTCRADVVVSGGGVSGVVAALRAAAEGLSVILVEERNCLGYEAATCWAMQSTGEQLSDRLEQASRVLTELKRNKATDASRPLDPAACQGVFHRMVAAQKNIRVFLFTLPVGVVVDRGAVCGVVVTNHAGRQVLLAKAVIDATEDSRLAAAAGAPFQETEVSQQTFRRLVRCEPMPTGNLPQTLPAVSGADECRIEVQKPYLAITCTFPASADAAKAWTRAQVSTLKQAAILQNLLTSGQQGPKKFVVSPEVAPLQRPAVSLRAAGKVSESMADDCLRPARVEGLVMARTTDTLETSLVCGEMAGRLASRLASKSAGFVETIARRTTASAPGRDRQVREMSSGPDSTVAYPVLKQKATSLPISSQVDVVVVGGGTSGALSAIAAARRGVSVALVEVLPNLGGTSSNRVNTYYWGVPWKSVLSEEIDQPIKTHREAGPTGLDKVAFSGEDKKVSLMELAVKAGVQILFRSFGAGAVTDGNRVVGVVVENASGRHVIRAKVVIDATGHGDVAVAAGAAFDLGRPTDGFLMEAEHGPLRDAVDAEDISKFYVRSPQVALSMNIRESRRIRCDYTVTMEDVLRGRRFPDVVARWRSNYDTHFPHSSQDTDVAQDLMAILGLFRKPFWGSIPYRAILPRGLDGILVVGKAYSTTHDALIGGRMQRDLQHLGEAAGVAAALACQKNTTPRALPIDQLQTELVRLRVLLPEELAESHAVATDTPRIDLRATAARLGTLDCLDAMVDLYRAGPVAADALLPLLKDADPSRRTEAALVLGMLGRREAAEVLLERLQARDRRTFAFTLPNASNIPSVPVYCSAVILLGRLRVQEAAEPIRKLLEDRKSCPPQVASFAIVALGRLGDVAAVDVIRPWLNATRPTDVREENTQFEAHWGVRTNAARTLARLGDDSGVPLLIELLDADQARLRDYARRLLEEIAGRSYGKDRKAWEQWWEKRSGQGKTGK
jgi:flavin-dependent dehydrogenase